VGNIAEHPHEVHYRHIPDARHDDPNAVVLGHWILAATILGSSMAFIDGTVANVALPAIQSDLGATRAEALWVVDLRVAVGVLDLGGRLLGRPLWPPARLRPGYLDIHVGQRGVRGRGLPRRTHRRAGGPGSWCSGP
jgi:hypothetical protein